MTLAERLKAPPVDPAHQWCQVGKFLKGLNPVDRAALTNALADQEWTATQIKQVIKWEDGTNVSVRHIRQHRNGEHTAVNCLSPSYGVLPSVRSGR